MLLRNIERTLIWQVQTLGVPVEPGGLMTPLPVEFDQRGMSGLVHGLSYNDRITGRTSRQI